jgi:hypothetical protein
VTTSSNIWTINPTATTIINWNALYAAELRKAPAPPPPVKHLKQDHSPNCCGCDFMSWFPQPDAYGEVSKKVVDAVNNELRAHKAKYNSMMLVILNNLQRPHYEKMLLDEGYKMIMGPTYHPGHGHNLYLYGYEKHPNHPNVPK